MGFTNSHLLQTDVPGVPDYLQETVEGTINFLPQLVGAVIILLIGWFIGRLVAGSVRHVADRTEIDQLVMKTPLGGVLGGSEKAVSSSIGRIAAYFVYALAILAAADALAVELLSEWIATAVSYLPAFVAGALIIVVGFVLADFLADIVAHTKTVTETSYTGIFSDGVRLFLYFIAIVIGLGTMGVDVQILNTFAQAAAYGLAAGIALAIGIAFGLGGRDYVATNIGDWLPGRAPDPEPSPIGQPDGGEESAD
ncbi:mechanosensitive ion channel family protein [Halobacteriaceae archaeon SHR40]|uniref:mechanosensitive ion channel family protein n=1 Tax=Halovenus amylolytica TaxID=2500550 RepID=UPI000FE3D671